MPRFSDLWTGGDFTFPPSPMPLGVTDTRAAAQAAAYAKPTATPDHASDLREATTSALVTEVRPRADLTESTATSIEDGHAMDGMWHDELLANDDDALALVDSDVHSQGLPSSTETTVSIVFDASKPVSNGDGVVSEACETNHTPVAVPPLAMLPRRRRALVWFRLDLRLHDNLALLGALADARDMEIVPIYIIHKPAKKKCGPVRFQFLLEYLADVQRSLQAKGSDLVVLRGEAIDVLRMVLPAWGITDLYYEEFVMPYATEHDDEVNRIAQAANVHVHTYRGRTLFDPHTVLKKNGDRGCTDFARFVKIVQELPQPPMPMPAPSTIPAMTTSKHELYAALASFCVHYTTPLSCEVLNGTKSAVEPFSIPTLAEFGHTVPETHSFLYGGETIGLQLLDEFCAVEERVGFFDKPRTSPACTDKQSTTTLSAYVTFGCVSLREFFYRIMFIQLKFPGRQGPPPVTLDGQLIWREFFYSFGVGVESFDRQDNNPMCMQINWKLQELPETERSEWSDETRAAMDQLRAWREGRTGYPWIDAVILQIKQDGWAHHVARHAVACFLTRGDLYISWLRGAYFFQEYLIDMDWPINIGNWLWVSSSCFFHDYHQIHSPSLYVQAWDPQGKFIRKWVPALQNMPARYIFEPWKAPLSVQRTAGCLIGKDYPFPIVDHSSAMKKCVQGLDGVHERAHQHDGVLTPCCDHDGKPQCQLMRKRQLAKDTVEQQQQQGLVQDARATPSKKRPRSG